ncbi:MAG: hypothetical protein ABSE99_12425 [Terracidiphilus sp.]|jgi:hypothetical protein
MKHRLLISAILAAASWQSVAQAAALQDAPAQDAPAQESRYDFRYTFTAIDDATFDSSLKAPLPEQASQLLNDPTVTLLQNQLLLEPTFALRYRSRWSIASSVVGLAESFHGLSAAEFDVPAGDTAASQALNAALEPFTGARTQLRVKEAYAGLSAGDFDFMLGRRMVRWGTGYAFTAAGVLDPPRIPTNPTDRLNLNEGRDMVKADWVHGPHALTLAWSSAALAPAAANLHDTTAFRYNVLVHGFDTALIAGDDRGGDAFGALAFTRVFGQAWELHGEAAWREHEAVLLGGKYTTKSGITFIGEFYAPPNIAYYRDMGVSPLAGRQNYLFIDAGKNRLRERPGWKEWDLGTYAVANLNDRSYTAIFDANRRFGSRFSSYMHLEVPAGNRRSEYGQTPYAAATSVGVRFQL